jgi:methenyltetrahydrofolate cyclohydrolase
MPEESVDAWLASLASRTPAPGGGAAAALAAATAAALVSMVAVYTTGERWADRSERMTVVDAEATELRLRALELVAEDAAAFSLVGAAYGLPKDTPEQQAERERAIQTALEAAVVPPREVGRVATRVVELADGLVEQGNPNVVSDVSVAASLARAALEAAIVNVEINRSSIAAETLRAELVDAVAALRARIVAADEVVARVAAALAR